MAISLPPQLPPACTKTDVRIDTLLSEVYAEWVDSADTIYHKETITVKQRTAQTEYAPPEYTTTITNLKSEYSSKEEVRFRVYTRSKGWDPTIYTVASKVAENNVVEDMYYKVYRVYDNYEVIKFATGSAAPQSVGNSETYTRLSYDSSGNYFDLDMSIFDPGYSYALKFMYYASGAYRQQPEIFKFRVEK